MGLLERKEKKLVKADLDKVTMTFYNCC